ncbi:hypothetical protein LX83_002365, partial [Goodfellowiella coeruleoviolacea]|nr:hypothetical protein [Goodfellowiella coeruleoviolacea]
MADTEEKKPEGPKVFSFTPGFGEGTELADKFSGAGIADTVYGLVKSIGEHNTAGMAAYGVGLAFDVAGMLLNPLGSLLAAGVGWLIDHLFFLREPLDLLMGDPSAVKQNTDMIKEDAEKYNEVATAHTEALKALEKWTGKAAEAFKASMTQLTDEILAIGEAVKGAAQMMNTMGGCVAGFRSLIRDIIAALLGNLIAGALIAAGLAPITLGASIVAYVGVAVASAVATMGKIVPMLSKLSSMLSANKTALAQLDDMVHTVGVNLGRFDKPGGGGAAGTTTSSAAGAGGKIHTPPTTGSNSAGTSASGAGSSAAGAGGKIHTPPTTGTNSAGTTTSSAGTSTAGAGGKINTPPTTG